MSARAWALLEEIAQTYRALLGDALVGVYAHGSLAFGCFRWAVSDIDFLVVTRVEPALDAQKEMLRALLDHLADAPPKGFEMSAVLLKDCRQFVHPTPFWLHFSKTHQAACEADLSAYCVRMKGVDGDLAAHFTVTRRVGRVVLGEAVDKVFAPVPWADYLDSILRDVADAEEQMGENPLYATLNLCRVLAAIEAGQVLSKTEGGAWGAQNLPDEPAALARAALAGYRDGAPFAVDEESARRFCAYMRERMRASGCALGTLSEKP